MPTPKKSLSNLIESSLVTTSSTEETAPSPSQESGTQEQTGTSQRLVEVVVPNETVLHTAATQEEAEKWANTNLDYRYKVAYRESVM